MGGDRARLNEDWEHAPSLKKRKKSSEVFGGHDISHLDDPVGGVRRGSVDEGSTGSSRRPKNRVTKAQTKLRVPVPFKEDLKMFAKKKAAKDAFRQAAEAEVEEKRRRLAEYSKERQKKARLLDKKNSKGQPVMSGLLQSILQKLQVETQQ
mmetsp:Transcript_7291/g.17905  ORF Transcript_7291/g.17905 Transcript_7291/m.17905 type:complete len:151 (+) Transcript_7291:265-717(+)